MKKHIKNLYTALIWLALILLGELFLYIRAYYLSGGINQFNSFQKIILHYGWFWILTILIIIQSILLNKNFMHKILTSILLNITTIIFSILFFVNISHKITTREQTYYQLELYDNMGITWYKLPCLILMIATIILTIYNTSDILITNRKK